DYYPAIITEDVYNAAQAAAAGRITQSGRPPDRRVQVRQGRLGERAAHRRPLVRQVHQRQPQVAGHLGVVRVGQPGVEVRERQRERFVAGADPVADAQLDDFEGDV